MKFLWEKTITKSNKRTLIQIVVFVLIIKVIFFLNHADIQDIVKIVSFDTLKTKKYVFFVKVKFDMLIYIIMIQPYKQL